MPSKEIIEYADQLAKDMAREMMGQTMRGSDIVGGDNHADFEFEGKKYSIAVQAFWEKSNWGEYELNGVGFDFEYNSEMFYF